MVVHERLASLERIMQEAKKLPLAAKVSVDKDEITALLKEIKAALPDELKQAKWISEERQKIIVEAHMEADSIINEAKMKVDDNEITRMAEEKAQRIIEAAKNEAQEIRTAARTYADSLLEDIQSRLEEMARVISLNREELK